MNDLGALLPGSPDPHQSRAEAINGRSFTDLLLFLAAWAPPAACETGPIPQSIDDCIEKFGFEDPLALQSCIEAVLATH